MSPVDLLNRIVRPRDWESFDVNITPGVPNQRITLKPNTKNMLNTVGSGLFLQGIVIYSIFFEGEADAQGAVSSPLPTGGDAPILYALLSLLGAGLLLWSLMIALSKREVVFGPDGVEVNGRSIFGVESWREPYSAFRGVMHREKLVRESEHSSSTYQIIELLHDQPNRSLPLLVEQSTALPRQAWEGYAKWFGLPAMTREGGKTVARAAEDLDKSIGEMAAEGKLDLRRDFSEAPPKGLTLSQESEGEEDRLRVTITVPRSSLAAKIFVCSLLVIFGLPIALICTSLLLEAYETPLLIGAAIGWTLVLLGGGVFYKWHAADRRSTRDILISRTTLVVNDGKQARFDLSEIEAVTLNTSQYVIGGGIHVISDRTQVEVGYGLSSKAKTWLKDYLTAAIATA